MTNSAAGRKHTDQLRLSDQLAKVGESIRGGSTTIEELLEAVGKKAHCLMVLLLSAPFLLTAPGVSMPFGIMVAVVGLAMVLDRDVWVPQRLRGKRVQGKAALRFISAAEHAFRWIGRFIKPRGALLQRFSPLGRLNGLAIGINGVLLALPLPPGTNFPPALAIVLLALGTIEDDAVAIAGGWLLTVGSIAGLFYAVSYGLQWLQG